MSTKNIISCFFIAGIIRYLLIISKYAILIQNRIEISTPLNSWKRVQEGAYLYNAEINPYIGDMYHENPFILILSSYVINYLPNFIPIIFVGMDLIVGILLYFMAKEFIKQMHTKEQKDLSKYAVDTEQLQIQSTDFNEIPIYVAVAYLFNPYSVLNCVGQTTTVWSNLVLAAFLFALAKKQTFIACLFLALETQKNFYPFALVIPAALILSDNINNQSARRFKMIQVGIIYLILLGLVNYGGYLIIKNWSFLDATYGFIFNHYDLQPNIGLFWYFFAEMFEHFRTLFLYTFQMNATVLYLLPLTIKLHKQPLLLTTILTALIAVFRSYPCVGDVAFYMALFPMWRRSSKFMANNFVVFCFFLITSTLAPTVWYLWIYCNSANANFYFGTTLAFASAQIFLITDLMFATNKREFCLKHGLNTLSKIALE